MVPSMWPLAGKPSCYLLLPPPQVHHLHAPSARGLWHHNGPCAQPPGGEPAFLSLNHNKYPLNGNYGDWTYILEVRERYQVDEVTYVDSMASDLKGASVPTLLLLEGPNTDSGKVTRPAAFDGISEFPTNRFPHLSMALF